MQYIFQQKTVDDLVLSIQTIIRLAEPARKSFELDTNIKMFLDNWQLFLRELVQQQPTEETQKGLFQ